MNKTKLMGFFILASIALGIGVQFQTPIVKSASRGWIYEFYDDGFSGSEPRLYSYGPYTVSKLKVEAYDIYNGGDNYYVKVKVGARDWVSLYEGQLTPEYLDLDGEYVQMTYGTWYLPYNYDCTLKIHIWDSI